MKHPRHSCWNCVRRRFGFSSDTSWDACDYVCHWKGNKDQEYVETKLLCIHGLSPKQVTNRLRSMGNNCVEWKEVLVDVNHS